MLQRQQLLSLLLGKNLMEICAYSKLAIHIDKWREKLTKLGAKKVEVNATSPKKV